MHNENGIRVIKCSILGIFGAGTIGLLELANSGYLFSLHEIRLATYLGSIAWVVWCYIIFGLIAGIGCFTVNWLFRKAGVWRLSQNFDIYLIIAIILVLPASNAFEESLHQAMPFLQKLFFIGLFTLTLTLILAVGLWILAARKWRRKPFPWTFFRIGSSTMGISVLICTLVSKTLPNQDIYKYSEKPHVVFISLDTVRADHLEVYGYPRPTTPSLTRFADDAVIFHSAFAPEPCTLPSHMTMMTALYPIVHGVRSRNARLNPERTTLAEVLRDEGGYTGTAFVSGSAQSWIGGERGFSDGFQHYYHPPHWHRKALGTSLLKILYRFVAPDSGSAADITESAIDFLDSGSSHPFFLFLHYGDAHSDSNQLPYDAPPELVKIVAPEGIKDFDGCDKFNRCATRFLGSLNEDCIGDGQNHSHLDPEILHNIIAHYDASIRYIDGYLGQLFHTLKLLGYYDNTLIILTADHGEEFLEHGRFLHTQLFREGLHVPLLIKYPSRIFSGMRVSKNAEHIDLMPTILDFLDIRHDGEMQGQPLLSSINNNAQSPMKTLFASNTEQMGKFRTQEISTQINDEKLIVPVIKGACERQNHRSEIQLYDMNKDPEELLNRALEGLSADGKQLHAQLLDWYQNSEQLRANLSIKLREATISEDEISISEDEIKKLKALGYLGD
ncbi:MAG: sulfatase [Methylococcales bacterium]